MMDARKELQDTYESKAGIEKDDEAVRLEGKTKDVLKLLERLAPILIKSQVHAQHFLQR